MKVNFNRIIIYQDKDWMINLLTNFLQCKICMNILNDPYDCLCCNQTFCKKCIINYIDTNKECPFDSFFQNKEKITLNQNDKYNIKPSSSNFHKLISSLHFYCKNNNLGCKTELFIEDIKEHEKNCQYSDSKNSTEVSTERDFNSNFNIYQKNDIYKKRDKNKNKKSITITKKYNTLNNESQINMDKNDNNLYLNTINNNEITQLTEKINSIFNLIKLEKFEMRTYTQENNKEIYSNNFYCSTFNNMNPLLLSSDKSIIKSKKKINNINEINNSLMTLTLNRFNTQIREIKSKLNSVEKLIRNNTLNSSSNKPSNQMFNSMSKNNSCKFFFNTDSLLDIKKIPENNNNTINKYNINSYSKNDNYQLKKKNNEYKLLGNSNTQKHTYSAKIISKDSNKIQKKEQNKLNNEKINEIFTKILDKKIEEIKIYLEQKCSEYLKEYFMELSFDNANTVTDKIDIIKELFNTNQKI